MNNPAYSPDDRVQQISHQKGPVITGTLPSGPVHDSRELARLVREKGELTGRVEFIKGARESLKAAACSSDISNGWAASDAYSRAVSEVFRHFVNRLIEDEVPQGAFFVAAVGGTGRSELTLNSDIDTVWVFESLDANKEFLSQLPLALTTLSDAIPGFDGSCMLYSRDQIREGRTVEHQNLASFLDLRVIHGIEHSGLEREVRAALLERAQMEHNSFVLTKLAELAERRRDLPNDHTNVESFDIKEGRGGLRDLHLACWIKGLHDYRSARDLYSTRDVPPELLADYGVLLKARSWRWLRHPIKPRSGIVAVADKFTGADFRAFRDEFGEEGFRRFIHARKSIAQFLDRTLGEIRIDLGDGVIGTRNAITIRPESILEGRNKLFFGVLHAYQQWGIPISSELECIFADRAREQINPHPRFLQLLKDPKPFSPVLRKLVAFDAFSVLFADQYKLESSLYDAKHRLAGTTKLGRAVERVENLEVLAHEMTEAEKAETKQCPHEEFFRQQYKLLKPEHLKALRIALITEEIPALLGQKQSEYVKLFLRRYPATTPQCASMLRFLMTNRRLLVDSVGKGVADAAPVIENLARIAGDADKVSALLLFTYAAFDHSRQEPGRPPRFDPEIWGKIISLGHAAINHHLNEGRPTLPTVHQGDDVTQKIVDALPFRFHRGPYARGTYTRNVHLRRLGSVLEGGDPQIDFFTPYSDDTVLLQLAAKDSKGLLGRVAGSLLVHGISPRHAEIYTLTNGLVLDFFAFKYPNGTGDTSELAKKIKADLKLVSATPDVCPALRYQSLIEKISRQPGFSTNLKRHPGIPGSQFWRLTVIAPNLHGVLAAVSHVLSSEIDADVGAVQGQLRARDVPGFDFIFRTPMKETQILRILERHFPSQES